MATNKPPQVLTDGFYDNYERLLDMPEDVPEELRQKIGFLRQWLNEDRNCQPLVSNAEIWHWLK